MLSWTLLLAMVSSKHPYGIPQVLTGLGRPGGWSKFLTTIV